MTTQESFELISLISLMNKESYLDTKKEDLREIVEYVSGPIDSESDLSPAVDKVIDYLAERYPRLVEAAALVLENSIFFDQGRYNSLMNLYRKNHTIIPMSHTA